MSLRLPRCDFCKHLFDGEGYACEAFPNGIPVDKMKLDDDKRECNNGIMFESKDDAASQK